MSDVSPADSASQASEAHAGDAGLPTKVNWDDSKMVTSFANVVNVMMTREEVTLLFGTNLTWNVADAKELSVQLDNRIVLTPFAAKRLLTLLSNRIQTYEQRFATLTL
jgi:hypothetical protein